MLTAAQLPLPFQTRVRMQHCLRSSPSGRLADIDQYRHLISTAIDQYRDQVGWLALISTAIDQYCHQVGWLAFRWRPVDVNVAAGSKLGWGGDHAPACASPCSQHGATTGVGLPLLEKRRGGGPAVGAALGGTGAAAAPPSPDSRDDDRHNPLPLLLSARSAMRW